ncbi:MAG: hypothetical protein RL420_136 [Pseudomonadota bacterium]
MLKNIISGLLVATMAIAGSAIAQSKQIKIGVIFDMSGALAAGGSNASYLGTKYAIDIINERGGVEGYKIVPIYVDAQSKTEVAINETERLVNQEKVDVVMGVFSSAQCVPMAQRLDQAKKFMWANVCVSSAVFKDKNLKYIFRGQVHSDQMGEASCKFLAENSKSKFGKEIGDLKVAIIYEDGPYGAGVAMGNEVNCKQLGMQITLKEGYAATAPDLSALVTKLRRARPDAILHTGYNPDITLFLRQSKEQGLKWGALIGHGAGYGQFDKLFATFKEDANYIYNVDPVAAQLIDPKALKPGLGAVTSEMIKRTDVLPRAIKKYGGIDSEALRKSALDTDIPEGGTIQGYGVKFVPPGQSMSGQNERSTPVVHQYINNDTFVVWPNAIKSKDAVLPLPKGHSYAN